MSGKRTSKGGASAGGGRDDAWLALTSPKSILWIPAGADAAADAGEGVLVPLRRCSPRKQRDATEAWAGAGERKGEGREERRRGSSNPLPLVWLLQSVL